MGLIKRVKKPTSHKGKKILLKKEPKLIEDIKNVLFVRGRKTTPVLTSCLKDLYSLKKPEATMFSKKNDLLPFENVAPIEGFCQKSTSSLFVFASSNKKRPNNLIIGRTFDYQLLDMIELGITQYKSLEEFAKETVMTGTKPCLLFTGEIFETKPELKRLKNLFIDLFHREPVTSIRLQGLEHVIMFTAIDDKVLFRSYRVHLKKSLPSQPPYVELEEIGPSIDFQLRRTKLASDDLFKASCKKPKELKVKKVKNVSTDVFGTKEARIHIPKQNIQKVQTKRMKGLRKPKKKAAVKDS